MGVIVWGVVAPRVVVPRVVVLWVVVPGVVVPGVVVLEPNNIICFRLRSTCNNQIRNSL